MSPTAARRICIVDDSPVIHQGLTRLLEAGEDLTVVGQARSAEEALEMIPSLALDVAIVDLGMTGMGGLELTRRLKKLDATLRVLILSIHDELHYVEEALEAGASGYVLKDDAPEALRPALQQVLAGGRYLSAGLPDISS